MAVAQPAKPASSEKGEGTDPEIVRIEQDLNRLNHDPAARHAFYHQIDEMVSRVRSGKLIPSELLTTGGTPRSSLSPQENFVPPPVATPSVAVPTLAGTWHHFKSSASPPLAQENFRSEVSAAAPPAGFTPSSSIVSPRLHSASPDHSQADAQPDLRPQFPANMPPIESPTGSGSLDAHVVSKLLYWAKQNHCPAELALATAWQESRMSLYPADGSSGEIGVMQILPARAKAEGVNPRSLRNPDVNMWLGTKLLAEYYHQQGSMRRAAMQYVAGPNVFNHRYPASVRNYIAGYSASVRNYAGYFKEYVDF